MRFARGLLYSLACLAVLLLAAGLFLPKSAHVERSVVTTASADTVFGIVNGFARFNEWSPWVDEDPATKYTFSGPPTGVGAKMSWTSDKPEVGKGSQEIIAVEPGRSVTTQLDFGDQGRATSRIDLAGEAGGTRITWSFDTSFEDDYFGRYFGLFFDRLIGADYEKGLARLESLAESLPAAPEAAVQPSPRP